MNRRDFLISTGAGALYSRVASASLPGVQFGYAAITWNKEERQAIDDIAAVCFAGIQVRADATTDCQPQELRDLLAQHKLTFVALSSGDVSLDTPEAENIELHTKNAKFLKECGGLSLQVLDKLKNYPRKVEPDEPKRLGKLLTEIGKRTADLGIPLVYHNHMNTISEKPANLEAVMASSDPKYVKLLLDTAHSVAGGGDPEKQLRQYRDRVGLIHLKDVVDTPMDAKAKYPFTWVELGRGKVDLPVFFTAVKDTGYKGWVVVELDRVPDKSRTPKQCAEISRDYLRKQGVLG